MKKILGLLLAVSMLSSIAFAETLQTANTVGQGNLAVLGAYLLDSNVMNYTEIGATTVGGYLEYGLTNKLDMIVSGSSTDLTGGPFAAGATLGLMSIGLAAKYAIIEETASMPAVAGLLGYKSVGYTNCNSDPTERGSQWIAGLGVSKILAPFAPYASIAYKMEAFPSEDNQGTSIDGTVGTAIAWSKQGAVFAEYTMQMKTPKVGDAYTQTQIALGVGYKM